VVPSILAIPGRNAKATDMLIHPAGAIGAAAKQSGGALSPLGVGEIPVEHPVMDSDLGVLRTSVSQDTVWTLPLARVAVVSADGRTDW